MLCSQLTNLKCTFPSVALVCISLFTLYSDSDTFFIIIIAFNFNLEQFFKKKISHPCLCILHVLLRYYFTKNYTKIKASSIIWRIFLITYQSKEIIMCLGMIISYSYLIKIFIFLCMCIKRHSRLCLYCFLLACLCDVHRCIICKIKYILYKLNRYFYLHPIHCYYGTHRCLNSYIHYLSTYLGYVTNVTVMFAFPVLTVSKVQHLLFKQNG